MSTSLPHFLTLLQSNDQSITSSDFPCGRSCRLLATFPQDVKCSQGIFLPFSEVSGFLQLDILAQSIDKGGMEVLRDARACYCCSLFGLLRILRRDIHAAAHRDLFISFRKNSYFA